MSLLVVGSIAFDSIKTPTEEAREVLGGSAVYFSLAASFLAPVRLVGVVGRDFPRDHLAMLSERGIDTSGVEFAEGKTFRWSGEYFGGMNRRETRSVELNVFEKFQPRIPWLKPSIRSPTQVALEAWMMEKPVTASSLRMIAHSSPRILFRVSNVCVKRKNMKSVFSHTCNKI